MDSQETIESGKRVGVVASDPLRSLGLVTILEDVADLRPAPMELEAVFTTEGLAAVVIDARATSDKLTETIARIRREMPTVKIIAMGEPLDPDHIQAVIASGAKGYLAETAGEGEIRMALEIVLDGSVWAPRKVLARLIDAGGLSAAASPATAHADSIRGKMTPREFDVLRLLMDGRTNRDIAGAMGIDEVTVKAHLGRMLRKTGCSNRVELTLRALDEGKNEGIPPGAPKPAQ